MQYFNPQNKKPLSKNPGRVLLLIEPYEKPTAMYTKK